MAQVNRTTLKSYFETGDTPTQAEFIDLIDSVHNINEDGTPATGTHSHPSSQITDFQEAVEDTIGASIVAGSGTTVSYDDTTGKTTIGSTGGGTATITVQEGDTTVDGAVSTLDFNSNDFDISSSPAGEANIDLSSAITKNTATQTLTNKTISGASNTLSNIPQSAVTNLPTDLAGKAASSHTHGVTDLTATGTRDATTFLRGDNTWATPSGGGGGGGSSSPIVARLGNIDLTGGVLKIGRSVLFGGSDQTVFTVPANKKCLLLSVVLRHYGGSDATGIHTKWKSADGTITRRTSASSSQTSGAITGPTIPRFIYEAGESFILFATTAPNNYYEAYWIEFDASVPVFTNKIHTISSAATYPLYTCPTGKCAKVLPISEMGLFLYNPSIIQTLHISQETGASVTYGFYQYPSGQSATQWYQFTADVTVGTTALSNVQLGTPFLVAGDTLAVSTSSATNNQIIWATFAEYSV